MSFDLYQAIASLRVNFPHLDDLDRAARIYEILNHKVSRRTLAAALGCNEKTVRNLSALALAPRYVQQKLEDGTISTREALRLIKAESDKKRKQQDKANLRRNAGRTEGLAQRITSWLQQFAKGFAEQTVLEAKAMLINAGNFDGLPKDRAPQGFTVEDIIEKCKPASFDDAETSYLHQYARWLALWVFHVAPDPNVPVDALDLAWDQTIRRAA
jgi:hypothetical protein